MRRHAIPYVLVDSEANVLQASVEKETQVSLIFDDSSGDGGMWITSRSN